MKILCGECRYWQVNQETHRRGECRRRAAIILKPKSTPNGGWPETKRGDWCGEAELKLGGTVSD